MIRPLNERVLVQLEETEEKTASGIVLPSASQEKPFIGKVVAVAEDTEDFKAPVKEGDRILFEKYAGTEISYDGEDYLVLKAKDIIAVLA